MYKTEPHGNADRRTNIIAAPLLIEVAPLIDLAAHLRNQVGELVVARCCLASNDVVIRGGNSAPRIALYDCTASERRIPGANGSGVDGWQI